jgi:HD-like signal output (HDOD) protein
MHKHIKHRIESIITNLDQMPSIPEVASKILNMVNDPEVSFRHVAEEISKDQAMTTNILKLCNSAYFSKGKEITSVDRAIVTIGLKEVKDIVMVVATKPVLNKFIIGYDLAKGDLRQQGIVVATVAKDIALKITRKDIADVVFNRRHHTQCRQGGAGPFRAEHLKDIQEAVETNNITFSEAERDIMGFKPPGCGGEDP